MRKKNKSLPKPPSYLSIPSDIYKRFNTHKIAYTGGQIAYFFILSFLPFVIFLNSLIASFNISYSLAISVLEPFVPAQVAKFIGNYLEHINTKSDTSILSVGIVLALFSSSTAVRSLSFSFNRAYGVEQKRGFFSNIFFSMVFMLCFALIIVTLIIFIAFGNDLVHQALSKMSFRFIVIDLFSIWRWITLSVILFIAFSLMYKFLTSAKVKLRETIWGTLFAIVGFYVSTWLLSLYVNNIAPQSVLYGSIGSVILLLLWMYIIGIVLILGAELNGTVADIKKAKKQKIQENEQNKSSCDE